MQEYKKDRFLTLNSLQIKLGKESNQNHGSA